MKSLLSFILWINLSLFQKINAQDISKLAVPTSPAFSILNFEPSAVMRPTNVKGLATDLLNSFDKNGKLLMNLGLEAAPYWLTSHPGLTREKYLRPDFTHTFLQSFSLSAATIKDSASGENKLSAGFRFKLYNGAPVPELTQASDELKTQTMLVSIINGIKSIVGQDMGGSIIDTKAKAIDKIVAALQRKNISQPIIDKIKKEAEVLAVDFSDSVTDIKEFLDKFLNQRVDSYQDVAKNVSDLLYQRRGFIVELAAATGFNVSGNNKLERAGFWINTSYYVSADNLFTLTARYMFQNKDSALTNVDVGLGFLKKANNYNLSVEGMIRYYRAQIPDFNINNQPITRLEKKFTYRLAVQGSYSITKDISLNINLGKDFDSPFISGSSFFSILGLNFSIFSKEPAKLK